MHCMLYSKIVVSAAPTPALFLVRFEYHSITVKCWVFKSRVSWLKARNAAATAWMYNIDDWPPGVDTTAPLASASPLELSSAAQPSTPWSTALPRGPAGTRAVG